MPRLTAVLWRYGGPAGGSASAQKLYIAGRDQTSLVQGITRQVDAVARELTQVGAAVPVCSALCFVGTELPWFGETLAGVPLIGRRGLAKLLKQPGDLSADERRAVVTYLASRFPPA
jgi:hypothetical protein